MLLLLVLVLPPCPLASPRLQVVFDWSASPGLPIAWPNASWEGQFGGMKTSVIGIKVSFKVKTSVNPAKPRCGRSRCYSPCRAGTATTTPSTWPWWRVRGSWPPAPPPSPPSPPGRPRRWGTAPPCSSPWAWRWTGRPAPSGSRTTGGSSAPRAAPARPSW